MRFALILSRGLQDRVSKAFTIWTLTAQRALGVKSIDSLVGLGQPFLRHLLCAFQPD
jgi:hypothetical protein